MENGGGATAASPYVSPPLPAQAAHLSAAAAFQASAAAAAAAAGAGSTGTPSAASMSQFQEAIMSRMAARPFGLSAADMKDLPNSPFAASLGLAAAGRTPESFAAAAAAGLPLLSHMSQLPFPHPFVDPRLPFTSAASVSGAFRPFLTSSVVTTPTSSSSDTASGKAFPSAFQPPSSGSNTKLSDCKGSPPALFSPGQNLFPRSSSAGSPRSSSTSPPTSISSLSHRNMKTDENSNTNAQLDRHDSVSPVSMDSNPQMTDPSSVAASFLLEHERNAKRLRVASANSELGCVCPICLTPLRPSDLEAHYIQELEVMAKMSAAIMAQHQQRQAGFKSPLREIGPGSGSPFHKVGGALSPRGNPLEVAPRSRWDTFQRIQRNRQSRIRVKLSRRAGKRPDEILEEEADELGAKPIAALKTGARVNDEEDIDIVGDKEAKSDASTAKELQLRVYGPPQFTEADVLACLNEDKEKKVEDEKENEGSIKREPSDQGDDDDGTPHSPKKMRPELDESTEEGEEHVKDAELTFKTRMEGQQKCAKCTKALRAPVVNVGCWHIQCEKCWLMSLGTSKSCSQCGLASSPGDLRRVFL